MYAVCISHYGRRLRTRRDGGLHPLLQRPATIAASCADYRAAASTDLTDDDENFAAGQKTGCPVLVLWGSQGFVGHAYEPLSVWQEHAADVRGTALPTGHFPPEEAPDLVLTALAGFLGES